MVFISNLILDRAIKISLHIHITSIRWLDRNCVLKYYNPMTSKYVEYNQLIFERIKSVSLRYILRWEWLFGELEKEKKRKWMTNKSWQRQHCVRIVQCLKTPIQNSCVRLFYPLSFKISKIPSQNVFCVFVTSSFLFLYCWYECHSNYSIGSWHKSLALTPTNRKWRSHLCILNICRLTYYLEYRK